MSDSTVESMIPVTISHLINSEDILDDSQVHTNIKEHPGDMINGKTTNTIQQSLSDSAQDEDTVADTWESIYMDWLEDESNSSNGDPAYGELILETHQDPPTLQVKSVHKNMTLCTSCSPNFVSPHYDKYGEISSADYGDIRSLCRRRAPVLEAPALGLGLAAWDLLYL